MHSFKICSVGSQPSSADSGGAWGAVSGEKRKEKPSCASGCPLRIHWISLIMLPLVSYLSSQLFISVFLLLFSAFVYASLKYQGSLKKNNPLWNLNIKVLSNCNANSSNNDARSILKIWIKKQLGFSWIQLIAVELFNKPNYVHTYFFVRLLSQRTNRAVQFWFRIFQCVLPCGRPPRTRKS